MVRYLARLGASDALRAAAALHDVIEDTDVTFEDIRDRFGPRVAELVNGASEQDKSLSWHERKEATLVNVRGTEDVELLALCCVDKLDNLKDIQEDFALAGEDKAASRLGELLAAVEHGNPSLAEPYLLTGPSGRLASILCRSMELFLVGRLVYLAGESGHDCRPCQEWSSQLGSQLLELTPTESQCVLADINALFAMEELQARYDIPRGLACWGADLLLAGLQIAETLGDQSSRASSDEPISIADRRMILRKFLHDRMATMQGSVEVLELWDWGSDLLEDLSGSISVFYEQHSRRIAVSRLGLGRTSLN